jgi:hypothetical protein
MPILLENLAKASSRRTVEKAATITEAAAAGRRTIFICHSHDDQRYVEGLIAYLQDAGMDPYVDWQDTSMPSTPNSTTAAKIKKRIERADLFMFLATPNSVKSRWCPWEIGYADGVKDLDQIFVVRTRDNSGSSYGNEYLGLYRRIDISKEGNLAAWRPDQTTGGVLVENL